DAAIVGVGIERIGGGGAGVSVGDAVARGVVGARPHAVDAHLGADGEAVVVAVGVERLDEAVAVDVGETLGVVEAARAGLEPIGDAVVVGVGIVRIGADHDLDRVDDAVAVGVGAAVVELAVAVLVEHGAADL